MALEPLDPDTAVELYLADRETELTHASLVSHRSRLGHFVRWCEMQDIDNLNDLTGRRIHEYRLWRRDEGDLSPASEKTQMDTIRVFVRWLESVDAVPNDLSTKVRSPSLSADQNTRDVKLDAEQASEILDYLAKYQYASRLHVVVTLLWRTMMRTGAVHALDVEDFDPEEQFLAVRHRPKTGTPIKNKGDGERFVALTEDTCVLVEDWLAEQRPNVTDEFGRDPLVTTREGRIAKSTIRKHCYHASQPCFTGECPHGREPANCEATNHSKLSCCPSSVSPHAIRRGSITCWLNNEMPSEAVGERANVTLEILKQHYDRRSEREKMEQRRKYLDNI